MNANSNLSELSYEWDFGSSSVRLVEGNTVATHVFSVPGNYTVRVTVSVNSRNAWSETSILVLGLPVIILDMPPVFNSEFADFSGLVTASLLGGSEVFVEWLVDSNSLSTRHGAGKFRCVHVQ